MKNTLLKSAVGAALLGVSALTLAASPSSTVSGSAMDSGEGFYILGQVGGAKLQIEDRDFSDDWGLAGRLAAGYLWSYDAWRFGLEAGALKHQDIKIYGTTLEGYLVDLLAVGKYYFNNQWNVFAKAGAAYVHQKSTLGKLSATENKVRPEAQVGLGYDFNQNLGVSLTYLYAYGKTNAATFPVHAVMAGVEYHIV